MEEDLIKVYIKADDNNNIIDINSSIFTVKTKTAIRIFLSFI